MHLRLEMAGGNRRLPSGVVDRTESDKRLRICLRRELHYAAVTQADAFIARMNVAHSASCDNTSQNDGRRFVPRV